jgi:hypothetical protein
MRWHEITKGTGFAVSICAADLFLLTDADITSLVSKLGPRKRLLQALRNGPDTSLANAPSETTAATVTTAQSRMHREREPVSGTAAAQASALTALTSVSTDKALSYARDQYERGRAEVAAAGQAKMQRLVEKATERINELEETVEEHEASIAEAKSIIGVMAYILSGCCCFCWPWWCAVLVLN